MSYISSFGNPEYRAIPALIDSITTDAITFSDGSVQVSAFNAVDLSNITVDTLTVTDDIIFSDASTLSSASGAMNTGVYTTSTTYDSFVPIPCSCADINSLTKDDDMPAGNAIAFIVLPGWSFAMYESADYADTFSATMANSGTTKQLFYMFKEGGQEYDNGTLISVVGDPTTAWQTTSVSLKVYYKGVEQLITGIS